MAKSRRQAARPRDEVWRLEADVACYRHHQQIPEVRMPSAAEGGVGKADHRAVAVLVAGAVFVGFWVVGAVLPDDGFEGGLGHDLNKAPRHSGAGVRVAHFAGAGEDIDVGGEIL